MPQRYMLALSIGGHYVHLKLGMSASIMMQGRGPRCGAKAAHSGSGLRLAARVAGYMCTEYKQLPRGN